MRTIRLIRWLRALVSWVAQPHLVWLVLAVIGLSMALPLVGGTAEWKIRLSGLLLQLSGVGTVAYGLRETRRLFGLPVAGSLFRSWFAGFPSWRGHTVLAGSTATGFAECSARGHVWTPMNPDASQAELLGAVAQNVERLNQRLLHVEAESNAHARTVARAIGDEQEARSRGDAEIRAKLEAAQVGGISISFAGLIWLVFGLAMATFSSELAHLLG